MQVLRISAPRHAFAMLPSVALLLFLAFSTSAQDTLTNAPNLSTATETSAATSAASKQTADAATTDTTAASASSQGSASATTGTSVFELSSVPTIAGAGIPTQVVPYTASAPYMQKSSLPSGTVFICVGAILGFLGLCVLAWRGLVAWSLHRSVQRAAAQSAGFNDAKTSFMPPGGGANRNTVYSNHLEKRSSLSLDHLTRAAHRNSHRHSHVDRRQSQQGGNRPPASLFFSPTAGTGLQTQAPNAYPGVHGNRSSTFLPAGYYASASSGAPASTTVGGTIADIQPAHRQSTNPLHNLGFGGPQASGYSPAPNFTGPSPPDSPVSGGPPSRGADSVFGTNTRPSSSVLGVAGATSLYERPSSSSLNLMSPRGGGGEYRLSAAPAAGERVPSAYLEDLFENHGHGMR